MSGTSLVLAAFLLMDIYVFIPISGRPVPVGDSFTFSAASQPQCSPDAELKLHVLLSGTEVLVASRGGTGSWKASASYADRLQLSDSSLALTNINYNDDGSYVLSCSDDKKTVQLEVVDFKEYIVSVNDTVHFPCHAFSVDEDVKSAWWKINGQSVVKMNLASQKTTTGDGYNLRVSVPTDWFSKKDFTLTVGPVQLQDQGDYICSIQDKHGTSRKVVTRLKVQETSTEQPGPFHVNEGMNQKNGHTTCVAIAIVVTLVLCAAAFGIGWWMRSRRPPPPPPPQREGAQQDVAVPLVSQNEPGLQPNGLALNGHR